MRRYREKWKKFAFAFLLVMMGSLFLRGSEVHAANIVVVLDPGHGGRDGGATRTWNGKTYMEKEIVLKLSKYTKRELEKYHGVEVYLTRTGDTLPGLEERVIFAKNRNATVLVSQHINSTGANQQYRASGALVFAPSGNYNYAQSRETANISRAILRELETVGLRNMGLSINLSQSGNTYPNGKLADYYAIVRHSVLRNIPGMIVEHGFVNNPSDCTRFYGSNAKIKAMGVADARAIAKHYGLRKKNLNGWYQENGRYYYLNADGKRGSQGWLQLGGTFYYLDEKGYRVTGWKTIGRKRYFFKKDGVMHTGLMNYGKKLYWFYSNGQMATGFFKGGDSYRYANRKGVLYTGSRTYNGRKYYFSKKTGGAVTGWTRIGRSYYYFDQRGRMRTGVLVLRGEKYYLGKNGKRQSGWVVIRNKKFYFSKKNGQMSKNGWMKYSGKWYYLSKAGYAYQNRRVRIGRKTYKFNAKGICTNR